jgi:hypothetical protein
MVTTMTWLTVAEYLCHKWPRICSFYDSRNPVLSSFMTYRRVCNKTDATCEAETVVPPAAPEFTPVLVGIVLLDL